MRNFIFANPSTPTLPLHQLRDCRHTIDILKFSQKLLYSQARQVLEVKFLRTIQKREDMDPAPHSTKAAKNECMIIIHQV
jgi:hypothetical protein